MGSIGVKVKKGYREFKRLFKLAIKPFVDYIKNPGFRLRAKYTNYLRKYKIEENVILYESYHGKNMTGNPYALYNELSTNKKYKHFKHIWAIDNMENPSIKAFKDNGNFDVVKIHSPLYAKYLATAKYLINDTSFPYYFQKRKNQIYINTWHGTPFKTMGKEINSANISGHANIQRNLLHTDYFINPNKFTSEKLLQSHDIYGLYNGYVVDSGYPRTDLTLNTDGNFIKEKLKIDKNKKVILYAPTWRGVSEGNQRNESEQIFEEVKKLRERFSSEYEVILKVHYFTYKHFQEMGLGDICVPNWIDTNELLSCTDILITDYSSIFFDFLPTKKPVIFYVYDKSEYEKERGFYLEFNDLPGPLCYDIEELIHTISNLTAIKLNFKDRYESFLKQYCYNDDGNATKRAIEIIFDGKDSEMKYKIINNKKKILLYCGGFYNNGITVSSINLSKYINHEKYDVTVIDFRNKTGDQVSNMQKLHPNTRAIYRVGTWNMTIKDYFMHNLVSRKGLYSNFIKKHIPIDMYTNELKRQIGNVEYDAVVDFGGYNKFWTILFAFSDIKWKCVYLHNDMMEEYNKIVNGKYTHKLNLKVIFSAYKYYDRIISVAKSTRDTNKKNLINIVPDADDKMVYVNNVIDYKKVLEQKDDVNLLQINNKQYWITHDSGQDNNLLVKGIVWPEKDDVVFVNMARLSPEKDQEKLIEAFNNVMKVSNKNLKLYIIGSGPLYKKLNNLVQKLNLQDNVIFTGQLESPFGLINRADCFVMSSNYEGQGLVILEALILRKHVVATDVTGVRSVLENGYGNLVNNDQQSLEDGMIEFLNENKSYKKFDYVKYNEEAMELFNKEVGRN